MFCRRMLGEGLSESGMCGNMPQRRSLMYKRRARDLYRSRARRRVIAVVSLVAAVAMLVFFAGAAGARVVAAYDFL